MTVRTAKGGLTERAVFDRLAPLISEVTGVQPEDMTMNSVLATDLGAESIDLLDLSFLIEEEFSIMIEPDEFERQIRERIPDGVYERDGCLTGAAVAELRKALPEIDAGRVVPGLRKMDIPNLLNVAVFVHLIQRKTRESAEGPVHA